MYFKKIYIIITLNNGNSLKPYICCHTIHVHTHTHIYILYTCIYMYYTNTCVTLNSEITSTSDELFEDEVDLQKLKNIATIFTEKLTSSSSDDTTCQMVIK